MIIHAWSLDYPWIINGSSMDNAWMDNPWVLHGICGVNLGSLWGKLGSLWGHFGITLGSLWGHYGDSLNHFEDTLGSVLGHLGISLGPLLDSLGSIPGQFGVNLGIQEPSARWSQLALALVIDNSGFHDIASHKTWGWSCAWSVEKNAL